jgi:hypothetical protein
MGSVPQIQNTFHIFDDDDDDDDSRGASIRLSHGEEQ